LAKTFAPATVDAEVDEVVAGFSGVLVFACVCVAAKITLEQKSVFAKNNKTITQALFNFFFTIIPPFFYTGYSRP
jgi:hypothetical protein